MLELQAAVAVGARSPLFHVTSHSATNESTMDRATTDGVVLAFDFGTRRIGVAIGNGITREARPLAIIEAQGDARWQRVAAVIAEWQPTRLVVGIARHPDGTPHEMTMRCEKFARQLDGRFRLPVDRVDERYSSAVVEGGRDDEAAAVILQQWFDEPAGRGTRDA
jgi:putative Holliday junction resolvase